MGKERILVVDDEPAIKSGCVAALKMEGYEVDDAETGTQALELIKKGAYNLLLLDIVLPDMTGVEILKYSKAKYPKIDVIIMTANPSLETVMGALRMGAFDYIVKPFNIVELVSRIKRCLLQQQLRDGDIQLIKQLKKQTAIFEEMLEEKTMELRIALDKLQRLEASPPPPKGAESEEETKTQ